MNFVRTDKTLPNLDLSLLAPRCVNNLKQFKEITSALRSRHLYSAPVWRNSFNYGPACREEIEEFLNMSEDFQEYMYPCFGNAMRTDVKRPLGAYDPLVRKKASYKEFWTMDDVSGKNAKWVTLRPGVKNFDEIYHNFLLTGLLRSHNLLSMTPADRMMGTYYLILMNKTSEALRVFSSIPEQKDNQLYDNMKGYLAMHETDKMMGLSNLASKYLKSDNIGPKMRAKWQGISNFLGELRDSKEFEGEFVYETEEERRLRLEKILKIEMEGKDHIIVHKNIASVTIKLYKIDIELMFSTAPFTRSNKSYRYVEPTKTATAALPEGTGVKKTAFSELLQLNSESGDNFLFEIIGEEFCCTDALYLNGFDVQKSETQIRVLRRKEGTPVVKAYVKVYAQTAAEPDGVFYKDGYTDLRGRFDYRTVCTNHLEEVERFAILVKTISNGADVLYLGNATKE